MSNLSGTTIVLDGVRVTVGALRGGSCGEVYEVETDSFGAAALKVLPDNAESLRDQMLRQETEILKRLSGHSNVVSLLKYGEMESCPWMLLERLQRNQPCKKMSKTAAIRGLAEIASGLVEAHKLGIVHRDLDPANIMLSGETWKLIDWGAAYFPDDPIDAAILASYATPSTTAPETAKGIINDPRIDIYSLGCCLFFFLSCTLPYGEPFGAVSRKEVIDRHIHQPIPKLPDDIPDAYQQLVNELMAKDPNARVHTATEVRQRLLALPAIEEGADE